MLLRADLLEGRRIALAGDSHPDLTESLSSLGAEVVRLPAQGLGEDEDRVGEWARAQVPLHALVYTAGFGSGGDRALGATLDQVWAAVREVAVGALIGADHPGKLVLLAPPAGAGPLAAAAAAGLENLARTLSVEWARYDITSVMIAPGSHSTPAELATLVCFLVSPAGAYLSGCRLRLGTVA